eukprot:g27130.t1
MIRPDTLVALSALHPDPSVEVAQALSLSSLYGIADNFSEDEQQAIRDFRAAARSCYSKLGKKAKAQLIEVGDSIFAQSTVEDVHVLVCRWLGNGKWGWVMMAPKRHGGQAVLKMSDVHHADVTAKEWIHGSKMGRGHRNIVEYLNVYLYGDENQTFKKKLQDGYRDGKLKSDIQRKSFPTHYVCMTIEEMNCGSVQGWLDKEILNPQGILG